MRNSGIDRKSAPPRLSNKVAVLSNNDWMRIQNALSNHDPKREAHEQRLRERQELRDRSKEVVKNWDNTIEGQRQKKLKAKAIRDEEDEKHRQVVDKQEAIFQAEERKKAIEAAKKGLYYQTDRVKGFHSGLVLTEVLAERDNQLKRSERKKQYQAILDKAQVEQQKKDYETAMKEDYEKAMERANAAKGTAQVLKHQMLEHIEQSEEEKKKDIADGQVLKQQVKVFKAAEQTIEAERKLEKKKLMQVYQGEIENKKATELEAIKKEELENQERRKFVNAKRKMANMRKKKEQELFQDFQKCQDDMCNRLHGMKTQEIDDEDERIEKTVQDREDKRRKEQEAKQLKYNEHQKAIHEHLMSNMEHKKKMEEKARAEDMALLQLRVKEDEDYQAQMEKEKGMRVEKSKALQGFHQNQVKTKEEVKETQRKVNLEVDKKNADILIEEEADFQKYASQVIADAKAADRKSVV